MSPDNLSRRSWLFGQWTSFRYMIRMLWGYQTLIRCFSQWIWLHPLSYLAQRFSCQQKIFISWSSGKTSTISISHWAKGHGLVSKSLAVWWMRRKRTDILYICRRKLGHLSTWEANDTLESGLGGLVIFPRSVVHNCLHESRKLHFQQSLGGRTVYKAPNMIFYTSLFRRRPQTFSPTTLLDRPQEWQWACAWWSLDQSWVFRTESMRRPRY